MRIVGEVLRDAERLAGITWMGREELDDLAPLPRRAPRTEAKTLFDLTSAARASRHD
jgi:hypothetical protein